MHQQLRFADDLTPKMAPSIRSAGEQPSYIAFLLALPIGYGVYKYLQQRKNASSEVTDLTLAFGPTRSASDTLYDLWQASKSLGIDMQDVYGSARPDGAHWLGQFEAMVAKDLGKEAGLFLPSGTMAQQIMLKIAQKSTLLSAKKPKARQCEKSSFYAHHTSHLLRYEHDSYSELLSMSVHVVGDPLKALSAGDLEVHKKTTTEDLSSTCALLLEVPQREIGGQMTSWEDIQKMKAYCEENGLWFHMVRKDV